MPHFSTRNNSENLGLNMDLFSEDNDIQMYIAHTVMGLLFKYVCGVGPAAAAIRDTLATSPRQRSHKYIYFTTVYNIELKRAAHTTRDVKGTVLSFSIHFACVSHQPPYNIYTS